MVDRSGGHVGLCYNCFVCRGVSEMTTTQMLVDMLTWIVLLLAIGLLVTKISNSTDYCERYENKEEDK